MNYTRKLQQQRAPGGRAGFLLGTIYFGIAPLISLNQMRLGPVSVYNIIGVMTIGSLLMNSGVRTVFSDLTWRVTSALFLFVCLIGLIRAPSYAQATAALYLTRFAVTWLIVSLTPLDRRVLGRYAMAWITGLCIAGIMQHYNEAHVGFVADESVGFSYSRAMQAQEDYEGLVQLNLFDTYGYMAMAIAAVCCITLAALRRSNWQRAALGASGLILIVAERRGGFAAADLLAFIGLVFAAAMVLYARSGERLKLLMWYLAIAVTVVVAVTFSVGFASIQQRIDNVVTGGLLHDQSTAVRFSDLEISMDSWRSNPVLGVGLAGFTHDSVQLIGGHSTIVDVLAQLGIVGWLTYYAFMLAPLRKAFVHLRNQGRDSGNQECALIVVLGLILFFIGSIFNPVFLRNLLNESLVLLLALGATLPLQIAGRRPPGAPGHIHRQREGGNAVARQPGFKTAQ